MKGIIAAIMRTVMVTKDEGMYHDAQERVYGPLEPR